MKSLDTSLLGKSIAAALFAAGLAGAAVAATSPFPGGIIATPDIPNTPDNGMACRTAPNAYVGSLSGNTFFCKRIKIVNQALSCTEPGFPTKVIRQGPNGGGKDICAAPNRNYTSNSPLNGVEGIDYKFVAVGSTQVSTIVGNQRQQEATENGLALNEVDAKAVTSEIVVNHTGSEDKLKVTLEFATFPRTQGGFLLGAR
jgi:hypothetical protein